MDGPALAWYQWTFTNTPFCTWDDFIQSLENRFGDSPYTSHMGALAKLTQTSIVSAYVTAYEALINRTIDLLAPFLLHNFVSGLQPHIHREVQALHPTTIIEAQRLAKLQEEKLADLPSPSIIPSPPSPHKPLLLPAPPSYTSAPFHNQALTSARNPQGM
ncbi:hypothetical protein QN277_003788 [Acacia crassicarpa]|uniref:Ty3 transposon capsid-like protein domain-containing protein n=1 Tax=Acacia crassicarpa TaxID=499986 RepID=A0AAE1MB73_9FABA|nr:hypothetical protein QN277_003788 [Acacia crassicarpa]